MSQNRLRKHLETVYASNSVIYTLTCHAYNRVIRMCYQQLLLWLICLIHPTIDMNKYQDKIPTRNAIKNICMIDVLHKKDNVTQPSQVMYDLEEGEASSSKIRKLKIEYLKNGMTAFTFHSIRA